MKESAARVSAPAMGLSVLRPLTLIASVRCKRLLLVEHPGEQAPERPARLEGRRDRTRPEGGRGCGLGRREGRDRL